MEGVYEKIRNLREGYRYTQGYVSGKLGISQQAYSNYERNKCEIPARHAIELARLYHVSMDYILGRENDPMEVLFPDTEFVRNISYRKLLDKLEKLGETERRHLFSYLDFLQENSDLDGSADGAVRRRGKR